MSAEDEIDEVAEPGEQDESESEANLDDWGAAMAEQADAEAEAESESDSEKQDPSMQAAQFDQFDETIGASEAGTSSADDVNLEIILDIPITIAMEIGRTQINIRNLLQLNQGSVVELDRLAGEPMDVLVNSTLIAHGEVVVVNDKFGIRLTDVISPAERVKRLR